MKHIFYIGIVIYSLLLLGSYFSIILIIENQYFGEFRYHVSLGIYTITVMIISIYFSAIFSEFKEEKNDKDNKD